MAVSPALITDGSPATDGSSRPARRFRWTDGLVVLLIGVVAALGLFAGPQGKALLCGDSLQHLDGAAALRSPDLTPNFGFRKPGYTLVLAGLGLLTGHVVWSAIIFNYALFAVLPLGAFGLASQLHSRAAGWVAALLVIAQLQVERWADRIMTEVFYATLLTFGMWAFVWALRRTRSLPGLLLAGGIFAFAWLVRSVGVALVLGALICLTWVYWRRWHRLALASAAILLPLLLAATLECTLNYRSAGHFRTATSGLGIMIQTRARYLQGLPFPDTPTTRQFLEWLPEREPADAYRANKLDGCIARCRAIRDDGLDEWAFNRLAAQSGWETLRESPWSCAKMTAIVFTRHLLRQQDGPSVSPVPASQRQPIVVHPAAADFHDSQLHWYVYWFLPHRSVEQCQALAAPLLAEADTRMHLAPAGAWQTVAYLFRHPLIVDLMGILRELGQLWPGFALLGVGLLRLHRPGCLLIAVAYLADAAVIGAFGSTDLANARYQFVWVGVDRVLVACLVAAGALAVLERFRSSERERGWSATPVQATAEPL